MAMLNEILVGRFSQLLTRLFRIQGGTPAPQLTPEIQPVAVVVRDSPWLAFLKDEQLLQFGATTGLTALKNSYMQVSAPPGSGIVIEVEGILLNDVAGAAVTYLVGVGLQSTRAAQTLGYRDSRLNDGTSVHLQGPARCTSGTDAAGDGVATPDGAMRVDFSTALYLPYRCVLHPGALGNALNIINNAAGQSMGATIFFRLRAATPLEL